MFVHFANPAFYFTIQNRFGRENINFPLMRTHVSHTATSTDTAPHQGNFIYQSCLIYLAQLPGFYSCKARFII